MTGNRLFLGNRRYSSWSMRGWLAVRLAGLEAEDVVIPMSEGVTPRIKDGMPAGLVPYLEHDGAKVWESLAIAEYCAEHAPSLWPENRVARAHARAIASEMHAGFRALRANLPMNLGRPDFAGRATTPECDADIARIEAIWTETRMSYGSGGPFLFGASFGNADAMFAPVVSRFLTYAPQLSSHSAAYCAAVRAHPLVHQWYELAAVEPEGWLLAKYERAD